MKERQPSLETTPLSRATMEQMRRARRTPPSVALFVYRGGGVEEVPLRAGVAVVLGRDEAADVALADSSLSRQHARFTLSGETVLLEDLGSTNGTWVGGKRVERAELRPGDEGTLGAVPFALQSASSDGAVRSVDGDDRFRRALQDEIARARYFGRAFALLMVRSAGGSSAAAKAAESRLSHWHPRLVARLRPIDRASVYSEEAVVILAPEVGIDEARVIADSIAGRADDDDGLFCGVAVFPEAGTTGEELVAAAHHAARGAGRERRVVVAEGGGPASWSPAQGAAARIVESAAMREVWETAERVARSQIPVLCVGETGVGKELVARAIHEGGPRREHAMVSVNCGAIPSQLLESTLFGHERGAFTGAVQQHKGVFESAHGGTVFLDEVGELPLIAQAALLRVLETRRVTRVGSTREIDVDVRVVAATHRDVEAMADAGTFRMDLLYRLNAITIVVPPLRERREEIEPLAMAFLTEANRIEDRRLRGIDRAAMDLLCRYSWPGNVRELKNAIERAVVVAREDRIIVRDLPERVRQPRVPSGSVSAASIPPPAPVSRSAPPSAAPASVRAPASARAPDGAGRMPADRRRDAGAPSARTGDLRAQMMRHEAEVIVDVLRACNWNQTEAARKLDVPLRTLVHKIKAHGIKKLGFGVPK